MERPLVMAFGTFDRFHPGHHYYLTQSAGHGSSLFVVIARDQMVEKIKKRTPRDSEDIRRENVSLFEGVTEAQLGKMNDPFYWIQKNQPDVLCFGYDQKSFNDGRLETFLKENGLTPKIVTIPPFEPEKWKSSKMA